MYLAAAWPNEGSIYVATIPPRQRNVKNSHEMFLDCIEFVRINLTNKALLPLTGFCPCILAQHPVSLTKPPAGRMPFYENFLL